MINNAAVIAVERSDNRKLSHDRSVSTTWVSQNSCPDDCPFYGNGCYAENFLSGIITKRLNSSTIKDPTALSILESESIDELTDRRPLRMHVVGDVITIAGLLAISAAASRYIARYNQVVWTYTHAWKRLPRGLWGKISVLASCQTVKEVSEAHKQGYAAAMVVSKFEQDAAGVTKRSYQLSSTGLTAIPCLKQTGRKADCVSCKLCWHAGGLHKNGQVILFESHGARRFTVNRAVETCNRAE